VNGWCAGDVGIWRKVEKVVVFPDWKGETQREPSPKYFWKISHFDIYSETRGMKLIEGIVQRDGSGRN